jgi:UbiD family decarboxylase
MKEKTKFDEGYPYNDMRDFLEVLERKRDLKRINVPINCSKGKTELDSLIRCVQLDFNSPALFLENLKGCNVPETPLVLNLLGSRERTALAIAGVEDWVEAKNRVANALNNPRKWVNPEIVPKKEAPCKEVIIPEEKVDLDKHVPHIWFGGEGNAYITCCLSVSKDPETGSLNLGWYRYAILDFDPDGKAFPEELRKKHLGGFIWWNPPASHIGLHYAKAVKIGKPLEVAIAGYCDPTTQVTSSISIPYAIHSWDTLALSGMLRNRPVKIVECETVDLYVPASAEWVIEGEVIPGEEVRVGPHANCVGFWDEEFKVPVVRVKCITHRKKPIWHGAYETVPPFDHSFLDALGNECELLAELKTKFTQVKDVVVHPPTRSIFYVIQVSTDIDKPYVDFGKSIIHAVWGSTSRFARMAKYVIVVGPDVDPYNLEKVIWAMSFRAQPISDSLLNNSGPAHIMDPSAPLGPQGTRLRSEQMGIDATTKVPERFLKYPRVAEPLIERPKTIEKIRKKISPLFKL